MRSVVVEHVRIEWLRAVAERMFRAHAEECEPDLAHLLNPAWDLYQLVENRGDLICLAALEEVDGEDRRLIGYAVATLADSPHYRGVKFCQHDALYVSHFCRKSRAGSELVEGLIDAARERGAHRLIMHAKTASAFERMLGRSGFDLEETVWHLDLATPPALEEQLNGSVETVDWNRDPSLARARHALTSALVSLTHGAQLRDCADVTDAIEQLIALRTHPLLTVRLTDDELEDAKRKPSQCPKP